MMSSLDTVARRSWPRPAASRQGRHATPSAEYCAAILQTLGMTRRGAAGRGGGRAGDEPLGAVAGPPGLLHRPAVRRRKPQEASHVETRLLFIPAAVGLRGRFVRAGSVGPGAQ